jgi:hypothetical protein
MTPSTLQTDFKPQILTQLDEVARLRPGWDGAGAPPLRADILAPVRQWVNRLPDRAAVGPGGPAIRPAVVPLASGRLQLEWHGTGRRILELEFEEPDRVHYLKWDPDRGIEEEDAYPASDLDRSLALIDWINDG